MAGRQCASPRLRAAFLSGLPFDVRWPSSVSKVPFVSTRVCCDPFTTPARAQHENFVTPGLAPHAQCENRKVHRHRHTPEQGIAPGLWPVSRPCWGPLDCDTCCRTHTNSEPNHNYVHYRSTFGSGFLARRAHDCESRVQPLAGTALPPWPSTCVSAWPTGFPCSGCPSQSHRHYRIGWPARLTWASSRALCPARATGS